MTSTPSDVQEARAAFGARLRELRQRASLTGRALAARTGLHFTKVSRVEHGRQGLTDAEIRSWCAACDAPDQATDLIAMARGIEARNREWRRRPDADRYEDFRALGIYAAVVIPEPFRTSAYARENAKQWVRLVGTAAPSASHLELRGGLRRFAFVLEEQALRTRFGGPEVMVEQMDHLLGLLTLPRVSIGVIPAMAERSFVSQVPFWIWDDARITIETVSAELEITRRDEVALYIAAFDALRQSAVYGTQAADLIKAAKAAYG